MKLAKNKINVCISCDDNYSKHAGVLVASILKNAAINDELHIYILDGGVSEDNKRNFEILKEIKDCEINFVSIDNSLFADYISIQTHSYITLPAYYRLKLPSLLPNVDRIIYLDCDIIVNSSLAELFYTDMGAYPVAGVKDINKKHLEKNPTYVNSGVLVMDLISMRKNNLEQTFLDWTKKNIQMITMGDQEIINEVLKNNTKIVDSCWNVQSVNFTNRSSYTKNPKIIHFIAKRKPWHWASHSYHRYFYFKYIQHTPWALNKLEFIKWTVINHIASLFSFVKSRPLFFLKPQFYKALYYTYLKGV